MGQNNVAFHIQTRTNNQPMMQNQNMMQNQPMMQPPGQNLPQNPNYGFAMQEVKPFTLPSNQIQGNNQMQYAKPINQTQGPVNYGHPQQHAKPINQTQPPSMNYGNQPHVPDFDVVNMGQQNQKNNYQGQPMMPPNNNNAYPQPSYPM